MATPKRSPPSFVSQESAAHAMYAYSATRRRRAGRTAFECLGPQPCFFFKENKTMITPSAAAIAAAVKPTVEISARE